MAASSNLDETDMDGCALAFWLMAVYCGGARGGEITGIVSFGDSLSDVGNDYIASSGAAPPCAAVLSGAFLQWPDLAGVSGQGSRRCRRRLPCLAGGPTMPLAARRPGTGLCRQLSWATSHCPERRHANRQRTSPPIIPQAPPNSSPSGEEPMTSCSAVRPIPRPRGQHRRRDHHAGRCRGQTVPHPQLATVEPDPLRHQRRLTPAQVQGLAQFTAGFNDLLGLSYPSSSKAWGSRSTCWISIRCSIP